LVERLPARHQHVGVAVERLKGRAAAEDVNVREDGAEPVRVRLEKFPILERVDHVHQVDPVWLQSLLDDPIELDAPPMNSVLICCRPVRWACVSSSTSHGA
jgi:hypothetical protein